MQKYHDEPKQYKGYLKSALGDRDLMKTFSERKGLRPVSETIQIDSMTTELRNSLWNALDRVIWSTPGFVYSRNGTPRIQEFSRILCLGAQLH